jgi:hypothetical protein
MSKTDELKLALERSKYIFPTHSCYKKLMVGAIDVTMAFVALANVGLPDNYNYVWLGQDESGSLLLLS